LNKEIHGTSVAVLSGDPFGRFSTTGEKATVKKVRKKKFRVYDVPC
jgi:hypothetical protein